MNIRSFYLSLLLSFLIKNPHTNKPQSPGIWDCLCHFSALWVQDWVMVVSHVYHAESLSTNVMAQHVVCVCVFVCVFSSSPHCPHVIFLIVHESVYMSVFVCFRVCVYARASLRGNEGSLFGLTGQWAAETRWALFIGLWAGVCARLCVSVRLRPSVSLRLKWSQWCSSALSSLCVLTT